MRTRTGIRCHPHWTFLPQCESWRWTSLQKTEFRILAQPALRQARPTAARPQRGWMPPWRAWIVDGTEHRRLYKGIPQRTMRKHGMSDISDMTLYRGRQLTITSQQVNPPAKRRVCCLQHDRREERVEETSESAVSHCRWGAVEETAGTCLD